MQNASDGAPFAAIYISSTPTAHLQVFDEGGEGRDRHEGEEGDDEEEERRARVGVEPGVAELEVDEAHAWKKIK
jgi:hypothetical protein